MTRIETFPGQTERRSRQSISSAIAIALLSILCTPPALFADEPLDIRVEAAVTSDNNVSRSRGADKLSDVSYGINVATSRNIALSSNTRLALQGSAGVERFTRYTGLSKVYAGFNGEFQYRRSADFDAPTFGLFARGTLERYESNLRDGYRYSAGARVLQPISTQLDLFAAVAYNVRDGKSTVFDNKDYSARMNLDYSLTSKSTLYAGGEFRRGDIVSTAQPALRYLDVAEAVVRDDAFTDGVRQAYRLRAATLIASLGYNLALQADHSLDLSLRWVRSTTLARPGFANAEVIRYYDVQAGVAYLFRF